MDNTTRQKIKHIMHLPVVSAALNVALALTVYMVCRCVFLLDNKSLFEGGLTAESLAQVFRGGALFDLAAIMYTNLLYLLIVLLPLHYKERANVYKFAKWLFVIVNSLAVVINLMDTAYFPFSGQRATVNLLHQFDGDDNIARIILLETVNHWYFVVIGAALIFALWRCYTTPKIEIRPLKRYYIIQGISLLVSVPLIICGIRGDWFVKGTRPLSMSDARQFTHDTQLCGAVLNTPFSMLRTTGASTVRVPQFFEEIDANVYTPIHYPADTAVFNNKNVVVLIVESFAKEFVGGLNHDLDNGTYRGYTPFFDTLLEKGVYFDESMCNGRTSIDAMPAVLASTPKFRSSFISSPYSINRLTTIPNLLSEKGYHTAFFHGAQPSSMGFRAFAEACGFDEYYSMEDYCADNDFNGMADFDGTWGIWDEEFLQFFCKRLSEFRQPFMSSVFTLSSHHPFKVPDKYKDVFVDEGQHALHKCIRYADNSLRLFFEAAEKQPWYDNTIFVITADHASSKVTHDVYKRGVGDFAIPILIFDPSGTVKPGRRVGIIQQIDILPTLMTLMGYDIPYFAYGKDALNTAPEESWGFYFHDEPVLLRGDYALRLSVENGFTTDGYFDIKSDPMWLNDLSSASSAEKLEMENQLKAILQTVYHTLSTDSMRVQ